MAKTSSESRSNQQKNGGSQATKQQAERSRRVMPDACPKNGNHVNTRIYRTDGKTRYCICDDCGHTWKKTGAYAHKLRDYAERLAGDLDNAERIDLSGGGKGILLDDETARKISRNLKELAENPNE